MSGDELGACEYCNDVTGEPVRVYDAGNGTTAVFHSDCHAEMMGAEACGDGLDEDDVPS